MAINRASCRSTPSFVHLKMLAKFYNNFSEIKTFPTFLFKCFIKGLFLLWKKLVKEKHTDGIFSVCLNIIFFYIFSEDREVVLGLGFFMNRAQMDTGDVLIFFEFGFKFADMFEKEACSISCVSDSDYVVRWCLKHRWFRMIGVLDNVGTVTNNKTSTVFRRRWYK